MSLFNSVTNIVPDTWTKGNGSYNGRFIVSINSDEFDEVEDFINRHITGLTGTITKLERVQNIYSYGRFMLRKEQFSTNDDTAYMVKKIAVIHVSDLQTALKYNLDGRRLDDGEVELEDFVHFYNIGGDEVLLIVNVLCEDYDDVKNSTVYFNKNMYIEYIVDLS